MIKSPNLIGKIFTLTSTVASVLVPLNAHAALRFGINNDYANVSQVIPGSIQPGTVAGQGFKIDFAGVNTVTPGTPKIGIEPFSLFTVGGISKPASFPNFVEPFSTSLTGNHQVTNNNSNIASAFWQASSSEVISHTGFVHVGAWGCAEADFVQYAAMNFTDSLGTPVGIPNFVLPAFGQGIFQSPSGCTVPALVNASDVPTVSTDFASIYRIAPTGEGGVVKFVQFINQRQIVFRNFDPQEIEFTVQYQVSNQVLDLSELTDDNETLVARSFKPFTV